MAVGAGVGVGTGVAVGREVAEGAGEAVGGRAMGVEVGVRASWEQAGARREIMEIRVKRKLERAFSMRNKDCNTGFLHKCAQWRQVQRMKRLSKDARKHVS